MVRMSGIRTLDGTAGDGIAQDQGDRALVVMPCHNESGRVGRVVVAVRRQLPAATVLVVNDDSADDSALEAQAAGAVVATHGIAYLP